MGLWGAVTGGNKVEEKQKIKANIDALYIKLNKAYSDANEISSEIDSLYSSWRKSGVKSHHGDSNEAKEMYSLKNERDSSYNNIKEIKSKISKLKLQKSKI